MDGVKLPTFDEVKASEAKPEPGVHLWMDFRGLACCAWCGNVRRADEQNKPCKGVVRVTLRTPSPSQGKGTQTCRRMN